METNKCTNCDYEISENDYCQYDEKFLRLATPISLSFTLLEDPMLNSTMLVWALFKSMGTDPVAAL